MARFADNARRVRPVELGAKLRVRNVVDLTRRPDLKAASAILLISICLISVGSASFLFRRGVAMVWASLGGLAVAALVLAVLAVLDVSRWWRTDWIPSVREVGRDALPPGFIRDVVHSVTWLVMATMRVADLLFYTGHRLMRGVGSLWRFHVARHAPQSLCKVQPFATLHPGIAATTMSMLHHADVRFDLRWLSFVDRAARAASAPSLHCIGGRAE
jgi:sterol desaturase/sphingolipid hydroxylase (fatty acid hydroxylase superfamily)